MTYEVSTLIKKENFYLNITQKQMLSTTISSLLGAADKNHTLRTLKIIHNNQFELKSELDLKMNLGHRKLTKKGTPSRTEQIALSKLRTHLLWIELQTLGVVLYLWVEMTLIQAVTLGWR